MRIEFWLWRFCINTGISLGLKDFRIHFHVFYRSPMDAQKIFKLLNREPKRASGQ